jgi:hypothetical protein
MANHWAIAIGISQYSQMDSLTYASRDVAALQEYFTQANFRKVYCFSDQSPELSLNGEVTLATQPTLANLQQFLELRFATPFLQPEDTLWFFFVGHGWHYGNQDYLMPADGNPDQADSTALPLNLVAQYLRKSGTQRVVLVLDACHTETQKFGQGFGTDPEGVVTLFSTTFNQTSRKLDALHHGAFTCAFLDSLDVLGQYPGGTIDHLYRLLKDVLPKLNRRYLKPPQEPRLQVDPCLTSELIQLPPVKARQQNWWQRLVLSYRLKSSLKTAVPNLLASEHPHPLRGNAIAGLTSMAVAISLLSYIGLERPEWATSLVSSANPPAKSSSPQKPQSPSPKAAIKVNRVAPTRLVPNQPDQEAGLGEVPSERTPRPGVYYTNNPQFTASRREIGKSGDRLCIKLINGSPNTPQGQPKITVSSVSRRSGRFYIDATNQKLSLGSFSSELSDGKLLWQRLETDVDESGLMGECLTAKAGYVRSYQTN